MLYADSKYDFLAHDNALRYEASGFEKTYLVEQFFEETDGSRTRISHKAFVKVLESGNDGYVVSVAIWNYLINNHEPDLVLEQLADKCRRPIENLVFLVDRKWQIIGLQNHDFVLEVWEMTKEKISREYSGEIFDRYVSAQEEVIRDSEILLSKLKKDVFISQYFSPIYQSAFSDFILKTTDNVRMLNINYEPDVIFTLTDDKDEAFKIVKTLDLSSEKLREMPIDEYKVDYRLDQKYAIKSVRGQFANHNRKFSFHINQEDNVS